jgi:Zn finger protein HypA/HybF involved in hydrogenase expression
MTREEAIDLLDDIKFTSSDYPRDVEALEMGIEALNKQIGIKPYKIRWDEREMRIVCPQCNYRFYSLIDGEKIAGNQSLYCPCCGQRIDWGEE